MIPVDRVEGMVLVNIRPARTDFCSSTRRRNQLDETRPKVRRYTDIIPP
jgi:hypothetical protein